MANVAVNATISARDAASGNINKVNNSLKALKIGFGLATAAAGIFTKLAFDAVKSAAEDEMSNAKLNAALKVRGFLTKDLAAKIQEQTVAMAAYGITDDQVRAGIEVGSRFFKDQETILKANAVAAQISAATGQDLASVMEILGKAAQGNTKGLKALGIETTKNVKQTIYKTKKDALGHTITVKTIKLNKQAVTIQDILSAASKKYNGIADEVANTTGGKFLTAQVKMNEALEKFGYALLPGVNKALDFFSTTVLPGAIGFFKNFGDAFQKEMDLHLTPMFDQFKITFDLLGADVGGFLEGFGSKERLYGSFSVFNTKITEITQNLQIMNAVLRFALELLGQPLPAPTYTVDAAGNIIPIGTGSFHPGGGTGGAPTVINVSIGTDKIDTIILDALKRLGYGPRE
jgi:hypothetical protein